MILFGLLTSTNVYYKNCVIDLDKFVLTLNMISFFYYTLSSILSLQLQNLNKFLYHLIQTHVLNMCLFCFAGCAVSVQLNRVSSLRIKKCDLGSLL